MSSIILIIPNSSARWKLFYRFI